MDEIISGSKTGGSFRNFPDAVTPILVKADSFVLHFHSDSNSDDWGYKLVVREQQRVRVDPRIGLMRRVANIIHALSRKSLDAFVAAILQDELEGFNSLIGILDCSDDAQINEDISSALLAVAIKFDTLEILLKVLVESAVSTSRTSPSKSGRDRRSTSVRDLSSPALARSLSFAGDSAVGGAAVANFDTIQSTLSWLTTALAVMTSKRKWTQEVFVTDASNHPTLASESYRRVLKFRFAQKLHIALDPRTESLGTSLSLTNESSMTLNIVGPTQSLEPISGSSVVVDFRSQRANSYGYRLDISPDYGESFHFDEDRKLSTRLLQNPHVIQLLSNSLNSSDHSIRLESVRTLGNLMFVEDTDKLFDTKAFICNIFVEYLHRQWAGAASEHRGVYRTVNKVRQHNENAHRLGLMVCTNKSN